MNCADYNLELVLGFPGNMLLLLGRRLEQISKGKIELP